MLQPKETIIYITRDIERALGMTPCSNYIIVSNRSNYGKIVQKQFPDFVTLVDIEGDESAGTGDLMKSPETRQLVDKIAKSTGAKPYILVFKNTARIEPLSHERGWTIINPTAATSEKIENKISQITWLDELKSFLPKHKIEFTKNIHWGNKPFILQWAHGHTGTGTILIKSEEELVALKTKFPERRGRLSDYIDGPSFTVNVIVTPETVSAGTPSYQITGLPPFTDSQFTTIGNDWNLANKILSIEDKQWIQDLINLIGARMQKEYWRGLFGIDIIKDKHTGKWFLIEINARQPASTTFESQLQESRRQEGAMGLTTFESHVLALMGKPLTKPLIEIIDGAQIIQRVTNNIKTVTNNKIELLGHGGFKTIPYENTALNTDLLRIQSDKGVMSDHNEFNDTGRDIIRKLGGQSNIPEFDK